MKRCPCCPQSVLDFSRFLQLKRHRLTEILCTFTSSQRFHFDVVNRDLFLSPHILVTEIFVLFGWISKPTLSELPLKSLSLSFSSLNDVEKGNTSSPNRRFVRQSFFCSLKRIPLLGSLPLLQVIFQAAQQVALFCPTFYLEVVTLFVCQDYRLLICVKKIQKVNVKVFQRNTQRLMLYSVERLREINGGDEHGNTPFSTALLQFLVRHQVIHNLM